MICQKCLKIAPAVAPITQNQLIVLRLRQHKTINVCENFVCQKLKGQPTVDADKRKSTLAHLLSNDGRLIVSADYSEVEVSEIVQTFVSKRISLSQVEKM